MPAQQAPRYQFLKAEVSDWRTMGGKTVYVHDDEDCRSEIGRDNECWDYVTEAPAGTKCAWCGEPVAVPPTPVTVPLAPADRDGITCARGCGDLVKDEGECCPECAADEAEYQGERDR